MIFSGDLHNLFKKLLQEIERLDIRDETIINQGDSNIGFYRDSISQLVNEVNPALKHRNIHLYIVRGNHDDPRFFMGKYLNLFSNIHLVPDYTLLNISGKNILFIGGAISVDRVKRKEIELNNENLAGQMVTYFENEGLRFTPDDRKKIEEMRGVDIVVTHTAPRWCEPLLNLSNEDDVNLSKELVIERNLMSEILEIIFANNDVQYHFYGHFHAHYNTEYKGVQHYCLGELELKFIYG